MVDGEGTGANESSPGLEDAPAEDRRVRSERELTKLLSSRRVINRATLRGVLALVLGCVVVMWPAYSDDFIGAVVGTALVGSALISFVGVARPVPRSSLATAGGQIVVGVILMSWPGATIHVVGAFIGLAAIGVGVIQGLRALLARTPDAERSWRVVRSALLVLGGIGAVTVPDAMVLLVVIVVGVAWLVSAVIATFYVVSSPHRDTRDAPDDPADTLRIVGLWLRSHELAGDEREWLTDKLFYEGAEFRARLGRFTALMFFATVIATLGVASDSTAVVIGAMLISPLMTPIMATAAALIMAWPRRAVRAGLTVVLGTAGAILLAFLIAKCLPFAPSAADNSQIASRVTPTLLDLVVALAAGAAGAYGMTRRDVSDALPGVAIAIALVPPLGVIGITLSGGLYDEALGALLLFLTNLVSILLAGGIVFVLTGFTPVFRLQQESVRVRTAIGSVVVGLVIVAVPLSLTGRQIAADALAQNEAEAAVDDWLGADTPFHVESVEVSGDDVEVVIAGPGTAPPVNDLADRLDESLGHVVVAELHVLPETVERSGD